MKITEMFAGQWFSDGTRKMMKIGRWANPEIRVKQIIAEMPGGKEFKVSQEDFRCNAVDNKGCFCCCPDWLEFILIEPILTH